jgi:hypothetical protein
MGRKAKQFKCEKQETIQQLGLRGVKPSRAVYPDNNTATGRLFILPTHTSRQAVELTSGISTCINKLYGASISISC